MIKSPIILTALTFVTLSVFSQQKAIIPPLVSTQFYTASSTLPTSYGISYLPKNAGDQSLQTWWSPAGTDRETCWIKLNFSTQKKVNYILIHGGSHYPSFKNYGNLFNKNLRVKIAELEFSDGSTEIINLDDIDQVQTVQFSARKTSYILLRPLRYYPSTKWNDPCISHFSFGYDQ